MEPHRSLAALRAHAISQSLFTPSALQDAIDRLEFVQADPIRAPARAQDLILRQRAADYHAGDLERRYASLDVEDDYLYAYGFLSKPVWNLLHPRKTGRVRAFEKKVLEIVVKLGEAHPRSLEAHLGKRRVINAWGGYSKATTNALEWLHWRGLLRIARRESGIRIYRPLDSVRGRPPRRRSGQPAVLPAATMSPDDRLRALVLVTRASSRPHPRNLCSRSSPATVSLATRAEHCRRWCVAARCTRRPSTV